MKIALCFFGCEPMECLKYAKENVNEDKTKRNWMQNIIIPNNVDVFIHSWSPNKEEEFVSFYKPKKYIFENQIQFPSKYIAQHEKAVYDQKHYGMSSDSIIKSQTYSRQKTVLLKTEYEQNHGFKYDLVMVSRMDVLWLNNINLSKLNPQQVNVSEWRFTPQSCIIDYYFISSSDNVNRICNLYNVVDRFIGPKTFATEIMQRDYLKELGLYRKINYPFRRFDDHVLFRALYASDEYYLEFNKTSGEFGNFLDFRKNLFKKVL